LEAQPAWNRIERKSQYRDEKRDESHEKVKKSLVFEGRLRPLFGNQGDLGGICKILQILVSNGKVP